MAWFEEWFDTPLYEKLYAHRDEEEAAMMAALIAHTCPPHKYREVLDLACGRGRHSYNLAALSYHVLGADLSPNAIDKAKANIPRGLKQNPSFVVHDMRRKLKIRFDLIVNLFTSFGYFENHDDNKNVIKNVSAMLKESGAFVIDYLNPDFVTSTLVKKQKHEVDDIEVEITRSISKNMVKKTMRFSWPGTSNNQVFEEKVQLYDLGWFRDVFEESGLELTEKFGNYDGSPYDAKESKRMILFALKK